MEATTHPNPTPNPLHRKIDLQSHLDLLYLQQNLSASATQKLNLHFPPKHAYATHIPLGPSASPGQTSDNNPASVPDPLRQRVESLVQDFLATTWTNAKHSICVNGLDATGTADHFSPASTATPSSNAPAEDQEIEGTHFTYAPYDASLSQRVAQLHGELESLTTSVSNLRRRNPREGAEMYAATLERAVQEDERTYETQKEEAERQMEGQEVLSTPELAGDVAAMYERGLGELAGLSGIRGKQIEAGQKKSSLTETVGRVQRARNVVGELE